MENKNTITTITAPTEKDMQRTAISYRFDYVTIEVDENGTPVFGEKKTLEILNESDEKTAKRIASKTIKNAHILAVYKVKQLYKIPEKVFFENARKDGEPEIEKI